MKNLFKKKTEIPEDLGIKIGDKTEVLWTKVKTTTEQRIKELEDDLEINKAILQLAQSKITK